MPPTRPGTILLPTWLLGLLVTSSGAVLTAALAGARVAVLVQRLALRLAPAAGRLFSPFQRLHPAADFEGEGIGLATVQRVVAKHGGRVWAEAAVQQGATSHFSLGEAPPP